MGTQRSGVQATYSKSVIWSRYLNFLSYNLLVFKVQIYYSNQHCTYIPEGGTCAIIHTQCCTYIPDMSTNVTHFAKHMNKMIQAMDSPEASVTSLWETLTSSPW